MQWSCELWINVPVYPACLHTQCSVMHVCGSTGDTSEQTMLLWISRWMLVSWHSLVLITWCCHSVWQLHYSALSWALARWAPFSANCDIDTSTARCFLSIIYYIHRKKFISYSLSFSFSFFFLVCSLQISFSTIWIVRKANHSSERVNVANKMIWWTDLLSSGGKTWLLILLVVPLLLLHPVSLSC